MTFVANLCYKRLTDTESDIKTPDTNLLFLILDLLLLCGVLATLLYAVWRRKAMRRLYPRLGIVLLVFGTMFIVLAYLSEVASSQTNLSFLGARMPGLLRDGLPEETFWVLSRVAAVAVLIGLSIGTRHRRKLETDVLATNVRVHSASEIIKQSESRFRSFFETTSNSIYCYALDPPMPITLPLDEQVRRSHDAVLVECNKVFAGALGSRFPNEVIGSRMGVLEGNKDTEAHFEFFGSFVENDYRLTDYELLYKNEQGEQRAIKSSLTGIVSDGLLHRFWGSQSSVLDLHQTRSALAGRRRIQELLGEISSRLLTVSDDDCYEALEQSMEDLCRHVGADRTILIWFDMDTKSVDVALNWNVEGARHELPTTLATFPHFVEQSLANQVIRIEDVDALPDAYEKDREGLVSRGLKSVLALPLKVDGEICGISSYAMLRNARVWTDQEVGELQVFAELFANVVMRVKSRHALDDALASLQKVSDRLQAENVYLREEVERTAGFDEIVGQSDGLLHCLHLVEMVADTLTPVLILGETGTGKELIARAIHEHSERRDRPLVKVNCAALPANLIESELFGYEKGAFTGAEKTKRGRFDLANGSTLFLDEIGDIPIELQAKLLRALQEGEIERLGGSKTIKLDVRIIAATNRNLTQAVNDGEFRSDLFYRINTFPIELPPLRVRGDDIQLLAENFINVHSHSLGREVREISADMMRRLHEYAWPGNVRELESVIQRALLSGTGPILELPAPIAQGDEVSDDNLPRVLSASFTDLRVVERDHILATLEEANWKISGRSGAAAKLGIPPSTLRSKMKKHAISRPRT